MAMDEQQAQPAPAEQTAAEFLKELRARLGDAADEPLARRLAPAVSQLTDRLVIIACDRLARADMTGFFEALLEGLTEAQRAQWRQDLSAAWGQAALQRWRDQRQLRQELLETILFVKALALS
jgi:uncharacterized protein YfaS (alpha-2-macroglobulin family)